jgi:hypothetical protein
LCRYGVEADAAKDKKERRRLRREARGLDAAKRALKAEARSTYGVKLSRQAPPMETCGGENRVLGFRV